MTGRNLPDFVIIGAMKSATSTLHSQLAAQPGFCMSEPKEPNFFSDPVEWAKGFDWYESLFAKCGSEDLRGESSTHYTKLPDLPEALPRLALHLPEAKFIYVMRHPIDRLISHYVHGWSERTVNGPIDEAVERHRELIDYSLYGMQVTPYLERFGKDSVLPVFMERLLHEPQHELERVCHFLGYARKPVWQEGLRENVSAERLRKSPLRDAIVENPAVIRIRRALVPQAVRDKVKSFWQLREKPQLSDDVRAKLEDVFDADLAWLGKLLGIDLNCSNYKAVVRQQALEWA